jgi:hypothetical protein
MGIKCRVKDSARLALEVDQKPPQNAAMSETTKPRHTSPAAQFGRADALQEQMGIDPAFGLSLAAILVFAANIENYVERAIWTVSGVDPRGTQPATDAKQITQLIEMLAQTASVLPDRELSAMLDTWCRAAQSGFIIRNNIVHGVTVRMETMVAFMRNPRWDGVIRKRPYGDLWADDYTLDLVRQSFAVLLRIIFAVGKGAGAIASDVVAKRALNEARSILGEFASRDYNPSFEKY